MGISLFTLEDLFKNNDVLEVRPVKGNDNKRYFATGDVATQEVDIYTKNDSVMSRVATLNFKKFCKRYTLQE